MDETSRQNMVPGDTTSRTRPKKRDRSASEERLLNAAEEVFAKHGFKGATTRMIADKAKVNESLIGRYFDGKMGLLFSLIERHISELPPEKLKYPAQPTVREELKCMIDSLFNEHCHKNEEFFKIVLSQCLVDAKFLKRIREVVPMKIHPELKERLQELQNKNKVRKDVNVDHFIDSLDTFFHGSMLFDKILMGRSPETLKATLHFTAEVYARSVEA